MTLIDGTEVTASDIDKDGNLQVYIERWNPVHDAFDHFTMVLPEGILKENVGFTTEEVAKLAKHIRLIKSDIIEFVKEKKRMKHMEHHPYITLPDETEITYSDLKFDDNGNEYVVIYFETPSEEFGFCDASVRFLEGELITQHHYTEEKLKELMHHYKKIGALVMSFVKEENLSMNDCIMEET